VATGTPEEIVKVKNSLTGQYLKPLLEVKKWHMNMSGQEMI
jgi:excinuclease UvrABC ATPase subunit